MSDIFISYTSEDRAKAECLANALEQQGWSVWWDRTIPAGKTFDVIIEEAIDAAKCVVVLWSNISVTSRWVRTEAEEGARRNILVPVLIEEVKIPLAFRRIQAADLIGWGGDTAETNFDKFVSDISEILGSPPVIAAEERRKAEEEAQRKAEEKNARLAQAEAKRKAEEERKRAEEETAKRRADEEERKRAEEEAHRKAEEEKANQAQADAKRKAERLAEEEKRKHVEDAERGRQGSAEQRKVKEEAAKREAAFEAKSRADEEERQKAEKQRHADLKEKQKAEEAQKSVEEDATRAPKETPASQKKYLVLGIGAIIVAAIFSAVLIMNRPIPLSEDMVEIPAGCFEMGGNEYHNEKPPHRVCVDRFAIGKYEVTFDEYDRFVEMAGRQRPEDRGWGRGNRPVVNVSWEDVVAYAEWLSEQTGKRYRLPTEAEWEYVARAGTETLFWWDDDVNHNDRVWANCAGCGSEWDNRKTAPVGSFAANPFQLHDTAGNVWEWVQDCLHNNYEGAPNDGSAWLETGGGDCAQRVVRGGSWYGSPWNVRSAYRGGFYPVYRNDGLGFRLAQDL